MKIALFLPVLLLAGCSPSAQQKANRNAEEVKEDVRRGVDKARNSPATKELEGDVKKGFHEANSAVTKELEKGREKVREGAGKLKRDQDIKNQP